MPDPLGGAVAIGATILQAIFPDFRSWAMVNNQTGETLNGDFVAEDVTRDVGANWSEESSLGRQNPIITFLNGKADTCSFVARFFRRDITDADPQDRLETLIAWTRVDPALLRPPSVVFMLGTGNLVQECIIEGISGIRYDEPDWLGYIRQVSFTVNLKKFTPFDFDATGVTDTCYHRCAEGDYYELICQREYGDPALGDVIRKRHPTQPLLSAGDIVKLPAIEGVRGERIQTTSIALKTAYGRKNTAQRQLRIQWFDRRNTTYVSHIFSPSGA